MAGIGLPVIAKSLGHTSVYITKVYSRMDLEPVRESSEIAISNFMKQASTKNETIQ